MLRSLFLVLLMAFLFSSCSNSAEEQVSEDDSPLIFYSLKNFINDEAERLNALPLKLDKTININGKEEHQLIETKSIDSHAVRNIDFHQELTFFSNSDINKLAWADKYQTDSTLYVKGTLETLHYTALDTGLKTQEIHLYFNTAQSVDSLVISRKSETALSGSEHWLKYEPARGYHIRTQQTNRSGDPVNIEITSIFKR